MPRPLFIVFEGIDGAGKSGQLKALARIIENCGRKVRMLFEPTRGEHGREIRRRAKHGPPMTPEEELQLFVADRHENVFGNIKPTLEAGDVILQDRYFYSTAAYQAARPELGLLPQEIVATHLTWAPEPDLVLLLDLPVEDSLARIGKRGKADAFEQKEFQECVRENFLTLAELYPCIQTIDARGSRENIALAIWRAVAPLLDT